MSLTVNVPKAEDIANLIQLSPDVDRVRIGDSIYRDSLERPLEELQRWLYCVLHAGNPSLFDFQDDKSMNLNQKIISSINDPWFTVPVTNYSIFEGTELSEVGGVRVRHTAYDTKDTIKIPCFRPNLTPGFFMFNHMNIGKKVDRKNLVRYYISTSSPEFAISIWSSAINFLLQTEHNFSTKVLSDKSSYPRNDAVVFYLMGKNLNFEEMLRITVQSDSKRESSRQVSPLCRFISPQVSCADDPNQNGNEQVSFGEHRCGIIAKSIQDSFTTGADLLPLLIARLEQSHVNPGDISKNF